MKCIWWNSSSITNKTVLDNKEILTEKYNDIWNVIKVKYWQLQKKKLYDLFYHK